MLFITVSNLPVRAGKEGLDPYSTESVHNFTAHIQIGCFFWRAGGFPTSLEGLKKYTASFYQLNLIFFQL